MHKMRTEKVCVYLQLLYLRLRAPLIIVVALCIVHNCCILLYGLARPGTAMLLYESHLMIWVRTHYMYRKDSMLYDVLRLNRVVCSV